MAGAQRSPSRAPSSAGNRNMDDSANGAALLGALMAFGGASKTNGDMIRSRGNSPGTSASSIRRPPPSRMTTTSPSPYRQPTALAAARMSPVPPLRPNYTGEAALQRAPADKQRPGPPPLKPKPRRLSEHQLKTASTSHIPPNRSFVGIVESNSFRLPKSKHGANVPRKPISDMEVRGQAKATPHEGKDQEGGDKDGAQRQEGKGGPHTRNKSLPTGQSVPAKVQGKQQPGYGGPRGKEVQGTPVRKAQRDTGAQIVISDGESSQDYVSASEDTAPSPATQRTQKTDVVSQQQSPGSLPSRSPLSHAPHLYPNGMSHPKDVARRPRTSDSSARSTSSHSNPSISATYHQLYPRRTTPLTLGDDLANAMVASSLATSRASSPHRLAPPAPQSRRSSHLSPWRSRTPSPTKAKGMRHTLREPETSSESDTEQHPYGKHKKKRHLRPKHPNKHHEGDRKRWRDAVTERERKRYEALFASNRGLLLAPNQQSHISPIVVRDLWIRSRLPLSELECIWNLVAPQNDGPAASLSKEEFVVGLWLIDQRLKGRKLPVKVSETVWASVRGLQGIKVKKFSG